MKLSFTVLIAAASLAAATESESKVLRRRLIEVDPDYAPTQKCKDGKPPPHTLEMKLFTDNYPTETMFWISDAATTWDAVLKHTNFSLRKTMYVLSTKICDGTYNVNVKDEYGDGLCCAYGEGYYQVFLNGKMIHKGGGGPNGGGVDGEFEKLDTYQFTAKKVTTKPEAFFGYYGSACVTEDDEPGEEGLDYEVFNLNFEDCMHKASSKKKYRGLEYVDDECRIWTDIPDFKPDEGSLCFRREYSYLK